MSTINECGTETERQAVGTIDDEEEERETSTVPDRSLEVDCATLVDVSIVKVGKNALCAECLGGANGGDNLFSKSTTLGHVLERELHVSGDELVHDATRDGNAGQHGGHGKGKTPATDIGEDETGDEGSKEVNHKGDLF